MFIVTLTYKVSLALIDTELSNHIRWLQKGIEDKLFIASGRLNPRTGGVILAQGNRDVIKAYLEEDPFNKAQAADYSCTEWLPSMVAPNIAQAFK